MKLIATLMIALFSRDARICVLGNKIALFLNVF